MNTNTPAPDYGEPWKVRYPADPEEWICTRNGLHADVVCDPPKDADQSFELWPERRARIVACVNACAGISDPAAHLSAMKEAIREAHEALEDWQLLWKEVAGQVSCRTFADGWPIEKATTSTLTKLQPFLK